MDGNIFTVCINGVTNACTQSWSCEITQNLRASCVVARLICVWGTFCIAGKWRIKVLYRAHLQSLQKGLADWRGEEM